MLKKLEITAIAVASAAIIFTGGYFVGRSGGDKSINIEASVQDSYLTEYDEPTAIGGDSLAVEVSPSEKKVNINTAGVDELDSLPGIGPILAERIIEYRTANGNFSKTEDILKVNGIGEAKYLKLMEHITVD